MSEFERIWDDKSKDGVHSKLEYLFARAYFNEALEWTLELWGNPDIDAIEIMDRIRTEIKANE